MNERDPDVIILGGGVAGLTCAVGLLGTGLRSVVIERDDVLGGRARSRIDPTTGDAVHIGPHVILDQYRNFLHLLERLGTVDQLIWQDEDRVYTLLDGERVIPVRRSHLPPPAHFLQSMRNDPALSMRDVASNLAVTELALGLTEQQALELDEVDARSVLERLDVSPAMLERYWAFASMSIMNVPLERCSAGTLLRFYKNIVSHPGSRVGFPCRGLGDLFAPAATRALEHDGHRVFTGTEVVSLLPEGSDGASRVVGVQLRDGRILEARHVVSSLPPRALLPLLPPSWREARASFGQLGWFEPVPYVSVYLWFDRKLTDLAFWARAYAKDDLNCDFYDYSNICPTRHEAPSLVGSNIIYAHRAAGLDDDAIIAATHRELAENLPAARKARVRHAVVHRIPLAVQAPYPGFEARRPAAKTEVGGLVLAGDYTRTGLPSSMESAAASGWRAAETVLAAEGRPQTLVQPLSPPGRLASALGRASHLLPLTDRLRGMLRPTRPPSG